MAELRFERFGYGAALGVASIEAAVDFAVNAGLGAMELNINVPTLFPETYPCEARARLKQYAEDRGVVLTLHAPEDLSMLSLHSDVRRASIDRLKQVLDFGADIGARRLTAHVGTNVYFTMPDGSRRQLLDDYPDHYRNALSESLAALTEHARGGDILLCVENDGQFEHRLVLDCLQQALDTGGLYLTWDLGHSYGYAGQEAFMRRNLALVRNCHVHDHDGKSDHLVPGAGCSPLVSYLKLLWNNDTHFMFEVRPETAVPACVEWLIRVSGRESVL